jgi:hypothetical protein
MLIVLGNSWFWRSDATAQCESCNATAGALPRPCVRDATSASGMAVMLPKQIKQLDRMRERCNALPFCSKSDVITA